MKSYEQDQDNHNTQYDGNNDNQHGNNDNQHGKNDNRTRFTSVGQTVCPQFRKLECYEHYARQYSPTEMSIAEFLYCHDGIRVYIENSQRKDAIVNVLCNQVKSSYVMFVILAYFTVVAVIYVYSVG